MKLMIDGKDIQFNQSDLKWMFSDLRRLHFHDEYNRDVKSLFADIIKRVRQIEIDKIKNDRGM